MLVVLLWLSVQIFCSTRYFDQATHQHWLNVVSVSNRDALIMSEKLAAGYNTIHTDVIDLHGSDAAQDACRIDKANSHLRYEKPSLRYDSKFCRCISMNNG